MKSEIIAKCICPPIPTSKYDWVAYRDGDEESGLRGFGESKQDAIDDLVSQENENL